MGITDQDQYLANLEQEKPHMTARVEVAGVSVTRVEVGAGQPASFVIDIVAPGVALSGTQLNRLVRGLAAIADLSDARSA